MTKQSETFSQYHCSSSSISTSLVLGEQEKRDPRKQFCEGVNVFHKLKQLYKPSLLYKLDNKVPEIYSEFQLFYYEVEKSNAKSVIKLVERKH